MFREENRNKESNLFIASNNDIIFNAIIAQWLVVYTKNVIQHRVTAGSPIFINHVYLINANSS